MRRRTQIVLAITFMVAALVTGASYLYISQILRQGINTAHDTASYLTSQLAFLATNAAPDLSSTRVDTSNPEAVRRGIAYYLGTDRDLNTMLDSVVGSWPTVYDAAILDADGKAILDSQVQKNATALPACTGHDEDGQVTVKVANLGRQRRDAREIFSALKSNVDQIIASLQDGLMLFTHDSRVVLVSAAIETFLGRS